MLNWRRPRRDGAVQPLPSGEAIRWKDDFSDEEWLAFMVHESKRFAAEGGEAIAILGESKLAQELARRINLDGVSVSRVTNPDAWAEFSWPADAEIVKRTMFIAAATANSEAEAWVRRVMVHPAFGNAEVVAKVRPKEMYRSLEAHDKRAGTHFVSTVLGDGIMDDVYEWSLQRTEAKCDVRDAYDLYQHLHETRTVEGAVAEFGSYRGHSGLLMAEALRRRGDDRQIYLFDTFDRFPEEPLAIDKFWSRTHSVDFAAVRDLFAPYPGVHLMKGEFSQTLPQVKGKMFSFIHVDCDSYRAVRMVAEVMWPQLARGGVIAFEDYGHSFCLGARMAVDDVFSERDDCIRFFSGFSGMYSVAKR